MCRWAAYTGSPIYLSTLVSDPDHSLIEQSKHADECKTTTNGDGVGMAWYDTRPIPGLYRDVLPAWSDQNVLSLAHQIQSRLFLAHVRATTGSAVTRDNCHPFAVGRWTFMHNGQVGGYDQIKRSVESLITDEFYRLRRGSSDSEALFLAAMSYGMEQDPLRAMRMAVGAFEALSKHTGCRPYMRVAAAMSDGETLYAVRYASDDRAPSLYYHWDPVSRGWVVVSEPLQLGAEDVIELPAGQFARFKGQDVDIEPFRPRVHLKTVA